MTNCAENCKKGLAISNYIPYTILRDKKMAAPDKFRCGFVLVRGNEFWKNKTKWARRAWDR